MDSHHDAHEIIREAVLADLPTLVHHRVAVFAEMGVLNANLAPELARATGRYFTAAMTSGEYVAWVAAPRDRPSEIIAGAGMQIRVMLPKPDHVDRRIITLGPEGLIVNVYVEASARRRGVARRLMECVLSWARDHGIHPIRLHASNEGRPLYAQLGFEQTNEMRLRARPVDD